MFGVVFSGGSNGNVRERVTACGPGLILRSNRAVRHIVSCADKLLQLNWNMPRCQCSHFLGQELIRDEYSEDQHRDITCIFGYRQNLRWRVISPEKSVMRRKAPKVLDTRLHPSVWPGSVCSKRKTVTSVYILKYFLLSTDASTCLYAFRSVRHGQQSTSRLLQLSAPVIVRCHRHRCPTAGSNGRIPIDSALMI